MKPKRPMKRNRNNFNFNKDKETEKHRKKERNIINQQKFKMKTLQLKNKICTPSELHNEKFFLPNTLVSLVGFEN